MDSGEDKTAIKKSLVAALILCFVFFLVELVAGWLCGSLAILSDAFHLLSDVAGFGLSLFAMRMSQRAATKAFSFGYKRFEVLAAVMSTLSIWIITVFLVIEAANRVLNPTPIDALIMFWTALFGVGVNIALAFTLHSSDSGCSHSHGGGGGHGHTNPHGGSHEHAHSHGSNFCNTHSHDSHSHNSTHSHSDSHSHNSHTHQKSNPSHSPAINNCSTSIAAEGPHSKHANCTGRKHSCHGHSHTTVSDTTPLLSSSGSSNSSIAYETLEAGQQHHHHSGEECGSAGAQPKKTNWFWFLQMENMDINVRAAAVHVISDLISSIGVMIASIILLFKPEWTIVDPLCTFFFSVLVFGSTWGLMSRCFAILLQGTPSLVQSLGDNEVESALCSIPFVKSVSKLNMWSLSQDSHVAVMRLAVGVEILEGGGGGVLQKATVSRVTEIMKERFGIDQVNVEFEFC